MEHVDEVKRLAVHTFILEHLSEEIDDCEEYFMYAEKAKYLGDTALATFLVGVAKDELRHFEGLMETVEKSIPEVKTNPLYPLLQNLEERAYDIEKEIAAFR